MSEMGICRQLSTASC